MHENLHPVLVNGNQVTTDLDLFLSKDSNCYSLFLGPALIEQISCDEETLAYKCLVGRLYNAGWKISVLCKAFNHDGRTIRKWASALLSPDPDFIIRGRLGAAP